MVKLVFLAVFAMVASAAVAFPAQQVDDAGKLTLRIVRAANPDPQHHHHHGGYAGHYDYHGHDHGYHGHGYHDHGYHGHGGYDHGGYHGHDHGYHGHDHGYHGHDHGYHGHGGHGYGNYGYGGGYNNYYPGFASSNSQALSTAGAINTPFGSLGASIATANGGSSLFGFGR